MWILTKKYYFPLFALFVIFSDELFHCFFVLGGSSSLGSGIKAYMAIFIAIISYTLLFIDIVTNRLHKSSFKLLLVLLVLLLLYYSTQFIYPIGSMYNDYKAHLLLYGSMCIPASYVGMRLSKRAYDEEILKLLPLLVILITLAVGLAQYTMLASGKILDKDNAVLNYQQASYYFAYSFSFGVFYLFFHTKENVVESGRFIRIIIALALPISILGCLSSGGRGGFLYLAVISVFLFYRIFRNNRKTRVWLLIIIILGIVSVSYLFNYLGISDSQGFTRITESATSDAGRNDFHRLALNAFKESPIIGNGLGSIWWTVGFYSHNIFTDLLADTGILGTLLMFVVLVKSLIILNKRSYVSSFDFFILLIFMGVGFQSLFSGYWFAMPNYFLVFGYVYGASSKKGSKDHIRIKAFL